jgi:hypothetical protein
MAPDLTSRLRLALALPRVLWLWTPPPVQGGFQCCHVSHRSQWAVGLRYVEKGLSNLPMQVDSRVSMTSVHVPKIPDVRAIMGLQDVWAGYTFNACKTCGRAATVRL